MAEKTFLESFYDKSGYKANDVDGHNEKSRVVITTNGGKYQVSKLGRIRTLLGPRYPKEVVEEVSK